MTDHIADASKKVEPCQLCGCVPDTWTGNWGEPYIHGPCDCFHFQDGFIFVDGWNETQRLILARRRKDFNAGYDFANHMERRSGEPDFRWDTTPKFYNYEDDGRPEEIDAFEMYLAKDRK